MVARFSAITIDVDSLRCYREIHGLTPEPGDVDDDPIYGVAMPRFWDLIGALGLPATLFLIGRDAPAHKAAFEPIEVTGSEVGNHSFSHDYGLFWRSPSEIREELARADAALEPLTGGRRITGFRAPGYNVSAELLGAVMEMGYRYDSSLLPSPLYFALRAAAIATYRLRGRHSLSVRGSLRQFAGPRSPYETTLETPWKKGKGGLFEIPIACEPRSRFPLIGTTWVTLPRAAQRLTLQRALQKLECFNFEMHAIDLLDSTDSEPLRRLSRAQSDLRIPASRKIASFRRLFSRLKEETEVRTLAEISHALHR